jgi:hypothetical protein
MSIGDIHDFANTFNLEIVSKYCLLFIERFTEFEVIGLKILEEEITSLRRFKDFMDWSI